MIGNYLKFSPIYYVIAIAILVASHGFVYFKGREAGLEKYYDFKASVEQAQKQLKDEAERARIESERITADVSNSWAAALDYARRHPRTVTVRVPTSCDPTGLRPVPDAELKADVGSVEQGFSTTVDVAQCEERLNNAVVDAAQVLHLQSWITQQHEASK